MKIKVTTKNALDNGLVRLFPNSCHWGQNFEGDKECIGRIKLSKTEGVPKDWVWVDWDGIEEGNTYQIGANGEYELYYTYEREEIEIKKFRFPKINKDA